MATPSRPSPAEREEVAKSSRAQCPARSPLSNIRVLAIGQNVQERGGEKVVTGETATLEITPQQAEILTLAQKVGQLSLVLRSLADANQAQDAPHERDALTVVRYGVAKQTSKR